MVEVRDLYVPETCDQDVVGLDVAVDDVALVRGPQGLGHLERHGRRRAGGERAALDDTVLQGAPWQILHRDVVSPVLGLAPVEDRDDVRVREGCGALGLTLEALDELLVAGVAAAHHLEGHVPIEDVVVGQVYVGHATAA